MKNAIQEKTIQVSDRLIVATAGIGLLLSTLDTGIINVAVPTLVTVFHSTMANGASALAPNFSLLLIARAVAGAGAGLYSPLAATAAASLVSKEQQGRALGMILGGMSVGTVVGVPLGMMVAGHLGWQGTFWSIAALGLIATLGIFFRFPNFSAAAPPSLRQRLTMMTNGRVSATVGITFMTSVASLGLYTYVASILQDLAGIHSITSYLWAWGIGGIVGGLSIGILIIDRTGRPGLLMTGILGILAFAMLCLPFGLRIPLVTFLPFVLWGAMGWASQAPQQHVLLRLQPEHGAVAVALNSSSNYLGGAVGSALGGVAVMAGLAPSRLPFVAGCLLLVALLGQLMVVIFPSELVSAS